MTKKITDYEYPKCEFCGKEIPRPKRKDGKEVSPSSHKKAKYCPLPATCRRDDFKYKLGGKKKAEKKNIVQSRWKDVSTIHYYIGSC